VGGSGGEGRGENGGRDAWRQRASFDKNPDGFPLLVLVQFRRRSCFPPSVLYFLGLERRQRLKRVVWCGGKFESSTHPLPVSWLLGLKKKKVGRSPYVANLFARLARPRFVAKGGCSKT